MPFSEDELVVIIKTRASTLGDYAIAWAILQAVHQLQALDETLLLIRDQLLQDIYPPMSKPQLFAIDPNLDQRPMSQNQALLEHGTVLNRLKPQNLVQAARADLKLALLKDQRKIEDERPYSFARRHVRKANGHVHLLAIALFEKRPQTDKRSTMIVYQDRALLREALIQELIEQERTEG